MDNLETYIPDARALHALLVVIEASNETVETCVKAYVNSVIEDGHFEYVTPGQVEEDIEALTDYVNKEMTDFDDYVEDMQKEWREDDMRQRIKDARADGY